MPVIRAFIAIEIPAVIHAELDKLSKDLQSKIRGRTTHWVNVQNIHLTLKFLGDVPSTQIELLTDHLKIEAIKHSRFEIAVSGIGAFPSIRRPGVIWAGIEAPPQINALQKGIETELQKLGYSPEDRAFSPHLTLARISRNALPEELGMVSDVLAKYKVDRLGTFRVDSIRLFKSSLLPGGAVYTPLFTAALKPDAPPSTV